MTVWTKVALYEVNDWLAARGLARAAEIEPVEEGSDDSIFRVRQEDGSSSCLRLFERSEPEGPSVMAARLAAFGLPSCPPLLDGQKRIIVPLKGKPAALYPWIDGVWTVEPSLDQIKAVGAFIGRMGRIGFEHGAGWERENPYGWGWLESAAKKLAGALNRGAMEEIETEFSLLRSYWQPPRTPGLPGGLIHGDLFRNNVLFDSEGRLAAVIDWGFCACPVPLVFELAIAANDWCLKDNSPELDKDRLTALLEGRGAGLPLTGAEHEAWRMALRWAALRFYLSRLNDYYFPRAEGKKLDPARFREILRARQRTAEPMPPQHTGNGLTPGRKRTQPYFAPV